MIKYAAILADPPVAVSQPTCAGGANSIIQVGVEQKYPTMSLHEIKSLRVYQRHVISLLFMWCRNPFLADGSASEVVRAWGFDPVTVLISAKVQHDDRTPSMKNGYWFRSASEQLIIATRGQIKCPEGHLSLPTWYPTRRLPTQ